MTKVEILRNTLRDFDNLIFKHCKCQLTLMLSNSIKDSCTTLFNTHTIINTCRQCKNHVINKNNLKTLDNAKKNKMLFFHNYGNNNLYFVGAYA